MEDTQVSTRLDSNQSDEIISINITDDDDDPMINNSMNQPLFLAQGDLPISGSYKYTPFDCLWSWNSHHKEISLITLFFPFITFGRLLQKYESRNRVVWLKFIAFTFSYIVNFITIFEIIFTKNKVTSLETLFFIIFQFYLSYEVCSLKKFMNLEKNLELSPIKDYIFSLFCGRCYLCQAANEIDLDILDIGQFEKLVIPR